MNIKKIKEYLSHKTWLWQRIFGNFYLAHFGLSKSELRKMKDDFDFSSLVILCRNEDDVELFWDIAQALDLCEDEMVNIIEDIRYCRPLSWQFDFVQTINQKFGLEWEKLELGTIADAYCIAQIHHMNMALLCADLDKKYQKIFADAAHKTDLLRRNFSLILETQTPSYQSNNAGLSFREMTEKYISDYGIKKMVELLKKARTSETKLSADESECMSLAYYSPFEWKNLQPISSKVLGRLLSSCVAYHLSAETAYFENLKAHIDAENDDEDDDECQNIFAHKHHPIYIDSTERCLIDVQHTTPLYANVYIERFPQDDLNNSLPDFIQYKKGWLYTVEFVDDLKTLDIAENFNRKLNAVKQELIRLEKAAIDEPSLLINGMFQQKYTYLCSLMKTFYCIY